MVIHCNAATFRKWKCYTALQCVISLRVDSEACFALIYWPEEDCVSIAKTRDIKDFSSTLGDGDPVLVKIGRQTFSGILKMKGTITEVRKTEEEYLKSLKEECPAKGPCANRDSLHPLAQDKAPSRKRQQSKDSLRADISEIVTKKRKAVIENKKYERGGIIVVDGHEEVNNDDDGNNIEAKDTLDLDGAMQKAHQGEGVNDKAQEEQVVGKGVEEELFSPLTLEDDETFSKPLTPEEEEELFKLWSTKQHDSLYDPSSQIDFEPWSQVDADFMFDHDQNQKDPLVTRLQCLEDTIDTLSKKYSSLQQRVAILEAGNNLAGFAMVDSLQATQHATAVQNTPTCTTPLSPQPGESDNMQEQSISDSSSNAQWEESLVSIDTVLQKYPKLCNQRNVSRLAVKLARESTFGLKVMRESTPLGTAKLKKLPESQLNTIKNTIRTFFPPSENAVAEFELTWKACIESIGQACKHERRKLLAEKSSLD